MNAPTPPRREPHYFDNESQGWPLRQCAIPAASDNWDVEDTFD